MKQTVLVKKGLSGYSRESVENYIKELDSTYLEKEASFQERIAELESLLNQANEEKSRLESVLEEKTKEYDGLYTQFNELKEESKCMNDQISLMHTKNYKLEIQNEKILEQIDKIPNMAEALDKLLDTIKEELSKVADSLSRQADDFKAENIVKGVNGDEE